MPGSRVAAATCLRMVFWGALMVVVDLRVDGVDLIPDVPGHLLIIIGLAVGLLGESSAFRLALGAAWVGLGVWVAGLAGAHGAGFELAGLVAVTGFGVWTMNGIEDFAERRGDVDLRDRAGTIGHFTAIVGGLGVIVGTIALAQGWSGTYRASDESAIPLLLVAACVLVLAVAWFRVVWRAADLGAESRPQRD